MIKLDFDADQIEALIDELGLTEKQARFAMTRALSRTTTTLRRMSEIGMRSKLDVRKLAYLRRRLKAIRMDRSNYAGARLWYGLNDIPVSALRGRTKEVGDGATFSGKAGSQSFPGGFVTKSKNGHGRTIFMRKGKARLPLTEARLPVKEGMDAYLQGDVFPKALDIFWQHFERDMRARAAHGVGKGWR